MRICGLDYDQATAWHLQHTVTLPRLFGTFFDQMLRKLAGAVGGPMADQHTLSELCARSVFVMLEFGGVEWSSREGSGGAVGNRADGRGKIAILRLENAREKRGEGRHGDAG